VRATQFFEFISRIADSNADGQTVRVPPVLVQPEAADDVAAALADAAVSAPVNGIVEIAGPEPYRLDEITRRVLDANGDTRQVVADRRARYFGAELDEDSLMPGADARIAPTRLEDWLNDTMVRQPDRRRRLMATTASDGAPNTIVLIHGFWVTPRAWEGWKKRFEAKGYTVVTPAYPGFEVEVEALRADPTPIEQLEVPEIIDMLENMIGKLDRPPIIMGHSAGGVFTQILLDHGLGAAGVVINSAPTEGVKVVPLSEVRSGWPVLKNPANRHRAVGFTPEQWHYVFANTLTDEESLALYERYHIPASGHVFWGSALANIHPGKDDTYVDYHNDSRPPLLFVVGKQDHLFPPKVGHSNAKHYKSKSVTEIVEFDGPHFLPAAAGWESVADYALDWAVQHASPA
jgi:pimeloyl-ACP methyl ester carboxylesterase